MTDQYSALTASERNAIVTVCLLAAFADGNLSEAERAELKRITDRFSHEGEEFPIPYGEVLSGKLKVGEVIPELASAQARELAQEMAVCICSVDRALSSAEERFLADLRIGLQVDAPTASTFQQNATALREQPPVIEKYTPQAAADLDEMIQQTAILAGALELMPQRLATMAIVPVQMRMVYKIGKAHGYDLDLSHTKELFATVGVGLTSQVVESYVSKIVGQVARKFVGGFGSTLATQATESAIAFATTYALGQAAKSYYRGGRTLSGGQMRELFSSTLSQGRSLQSRYAQEIAQRAGSLNVADLVRLGR